jgi:two-component sensor histidine kinase
VLLVSELVTDSVRHSASGRPGETLTVTVLSGGEVTQVQVTDRSVGVVTRGDFGLLSRDVMAVTLRASMLQRMQRGVWVGAAELPGCARLELAPLVDSVKPE